jgi:hypothetical protein
MIARKTNDGKKGGLLAGRSHKKGGIKAVVGDTGQPVELEGGEVIINKHASKKHWKELSRINQSAGGGVPILSPKDMDDADVDEYKKGGRTIEFNPNKIPSHVVYTYAKTIKDKYPKVWNLGGNIFGNEAFDNLERVLKRGYWTENEEWMFVKWQSFCARHKGDIRIAGIIANLKWLNKVDKGWAYMKELIEDEIKKRNEKPKSMKDGGNINSTNYFENTKADFKPISVEQGKAILEEYFKWRKKRNKPDYIEVSNFGKLKVNFESVNRNARYKSRGLSFYFVNESNDYIIRISDHWSKSNYNRSQKLNCGDIASCYWTNFGEKFSIRIPSETYSSEMIAGKCDFDDFQKRVYLEYSEGGNVVTYKEKFNKKYGFEPNESHSLAEIAKLTKLKLSALQDIYDKGIGAYKTNPQSVRPNVKSKEQWAMGRVYSAVMGGKAAKVDANELERGKKYDEGGLVKNTNLPKVGSEVYARWNDSNKWTIGIFKGETENGFEVYDFTIEKPKYIEFYGEISKDPHSGSEIFKSNRFKGRNYKNYHFSKQDDNYGAGGGVSGGTNPDIRYAAPNGKPSNLTHEQWHLVRTPEFKAWFGDWEKLAYAKAKDAAMDEITLQNLSKDVSKVVDENGEPLVVYHGTYVENPFFIFDFDKTDIGFHFGTYQQAKNRSETKLFFKGKKSVVNPFFLNIRKIYEVTDIGEWEYPQRYLDMFMSDNLISEKDAIKLGFLRMYYKEDNSKIRDYLLKKHNNKIGFEYDNEYEGKGKSYIVLEPNQIKLADGSNIIFDGSNPDIRYADGGNVKKDCIDFIMKSESIKNNGHYLHIKDINVYVEEGDKISNIKSLILITYNSGGQSNLKVVDTINAATISTEIAKLLGVTTGVARIIVSEQIKNAKRFSINSLKGIKNEKIIIVDRDKIVCTNIKPKIKMNNGGIVPKASTDPSTWNAKFNVGDKVKIRYDFSTDMGTGESKVRYESNENSFAVKSIEKSGATPYKENKKGYNIGGFMRPENPSGVLYELSNGQMWEGKDLELISQGKTPEAKPSNTINKPKANPSNTINKPEAQPKTIAVGNKYSCWDIAQPIFTISAMSTDTVTVSWQQNGETKNYVYAKGEVEIFLERKLWTLKENKFKTTKPKDANINTEASLDLFLRNTATDITEKPVTESIDKIIDSFEKVLQSEGKYVKIIRSNG